MGAVGWLAYYLRIPTNKPVIHRVVIRIYGHLEEIWFDGPRVDEYILGNLVSLLVSGLREEKS